MVLLMLIGALAVRCSNNERNLVYAQQNLMRSKSLMPRPDLW
jgi:hypothetical protein